MQEHGLLAELKIDEPQIFSSRISYHYAAGTWAPTPKCVEAGGEEEGETITPSTQTQVIIFGEEIYTVTLFLDIQYAMSYIVFKSLFF